MIAAEIESLQIYHYFISEIRIILNVLQNVKHESCSLIIILFIKPFLNTCICICKSTDK